MVYHGKLGTKEQPPIDYEELTRRNKYATLRTQESEPPDRDECNEHNQIQGLTKGHTPTTIPPI